MKSEQKSVECAACGHPIVESHGHNTKDFCSRACFRAGRAHCLGCGEPLPQPVSGYKKDFCNPQCRSKYYYRDTSINSVLLEEKKRTKCKVCGQAIIQPKSGVKFYCSKSCTHRAHHLEKHSLSLTEEWGGYPPETRKSLQQVQQFMGIGAANRLAKAIEREYKPRYQPKDRPPGYVVYHCKTCNKEIKRRPYGNMDRDYCSGKCRPFRSRYGEANVAAKLTLAEVEEIRMFYTTQHLSQRRLAEMYGVNRGTIGHIIRGETWNTERQVGGLTWEKVHEIRNLHATGSFTLDALGKKYNVSLSCIHLIVRYKTWKPEADPRAKRQDGNSGSEAH